MPQTAVWIAAPAALIAGVVVLVLRVRRLRRAALALIGLALGFAWCALARQFWYAPAAALAGTVQPIEAAVCDAPQQTRFGSSVTVRAQLAGRTYRLLLYLDAEAPAVQPGDVLRMDARLSHSTGSGENLYYSAKGIFLTASPVEEPVLERPERAPLWAWPALVRMRLKHTLRRCFPCVRPDL